MGGRVYEWVQRAGIACFNKALRRPGRYHTAWTAGEAEAALLQLIAESYNLRGATVP